MKDKLLAASQKVEEVRDDLAKLFSERLKLGLDANVLNVALEISYSGKVSSNEDVKVLAELVAEGERFAARIKEISYRF